MTEDYLHDLQSIALHMKRIHNLLKKLCDEIKKEEHDLSKLFIDVENKIKGEK